MKGKTFLHTIIDWLIEKKSEYLVDVWNILTEHVGNYATKEVLVLPINKIEGTLILKLAMDKKT